jgi:transaldolase
MLEAIGTPAALELRGKAAIANAKLAYESFGRIFDGDEFAALREAGARVQRCLWASTSTKNPSYRDVLYVEELIGPQTVNTMPLETISAFLDHGRVERTLDADLDRAHADLRALEELGVSMERVTGELIDEGVASFGKSFGELIEQIDSQRKSLAPA